MSKKRGSKPTDDRPYSLLQVATLLLTAGELYQEVHSPPSRGYIAPALCPHELPFYDYLRPKRSCRVCAQKSAEVHASIVRRMNLSDDARERVLDALIDLDVAMGRVSEGIRRAVARFIDDGPTRIDHYAVEFRLGQAGAVIAVQQAMNGTGKYARREAHGADASERLHAERAPAGDVPRLQADPRRPAGLRRPGVLGQGRAAVV